MRTLYGRKVALLLFRKSILCNVNSSYDSFAVIFVGVKSH